ncbi:hypothetical protein [Vreelandella arcis]|uniref:Uncharacterized protein n=1 Tax=Vreelandella arcis TaxID=416873 RepID=A0A1H0CEJ5_9GAMM|nr:hypothetical protein [Halomonas arcis]SDN56309.1 hypothetical protein SAMN04487951_10628 [Halomonas arcis]
MSLSLMSCFMGSLSARLPMLAETGRFLPFRRENALRFSLAGVQLKFSVVLVPSGGLTIPASGVGGSWIVLRY